MQIRGGRIEDVAGIARVQVDGYRSVSAGICSVEYLDAFSYEHQEQEWRRWFAEPLNDILYVAEDDKGRIMAYALAHVGEGDIAGYDCELIALHVREKYQRMGIGRMLLWTLAQEARRAGGTSMMLWILEGNPSTAFCERLGASLLNERRDVEGCPPKIAYGWPSIKSVYRRAT